MPPIRVMSHARQIFSDLTPVVAPSGWATTSMVRSIRDVVFVMMAGWQGVMVVATLAGLGVDGWSLTLSQAVLAGLALVARTRASLAPVLPFAMMGLGLWGYLASADIDSLMVFAASWQINFASCAAALLILRPLIVPAVVIAGATVATTVAVALPPWGMSTAISIGVTQAAIVFALRLGLPRLLSIASDTDRAVAAADDARARAAVTRGVTLQAAEQARVLHDTAINTLAAVAVGGPAVRDEPLVRRQCARDVTLLDALRAAQPLQSSQHLRDVFTLPGLPIRRSGLDDAAIDRATDRLPLAVISAAVGCVQESVTNSTKHSGASYVTVDVSERDDRAVVITVSDDGVGFDESSTRERGLSASIRQRATDNGIDAKVTSLVGVGTHVVLTLPRRDSAGTVDAVAPATDELKTGAARLWGIGVAVVSLVLMIAGGTNTGLALVPMIALMLLAVVAAGIPAFASARRTLAVTFAVTTLVVFALSAAAVDFGRTGPIHWQALAATGPFAQFLSLRLTPLGACMGILAWTATILALSASVWTDDTVAGQIVLVAGAVGLGFSAVWLRFQTTAVRYANEAARLLREAFASNLGAELDIATRRTYRRWSGAGLDSATELLRTLADGSRSPRDPAVREACGEEEQYLRQLLQVDPTLLLLGPRLLPALRTSRERGVFFTMRIGDVDAPDDATADRISETVLRMILATPAGAACSATIFPVDDALQLTLVAPSSAIAASPTSEHRVVTTGTLTIAEYIYPAVTTGERTSAALTSGSMR